MGKYAPKAYRAGLRREGLPGTSGTLLIYGNAVGVTDRRERASSSQDNSLQLFVYKPLSAAVIYPGRRFHL